MLACAVHLPFVGGSTSAAGKGPGFTAWQQYLQMAANAAMCARLVQTFSMPLNWAAANLRHHCLMRLHRWPASGRGGA